MYLSNTPIHVRPPEMLAVQRFKTSTWYPVPTTTLDHFEGLPTREIPLSRYGGRTDRQEETTGYFHARRLDDVWTLIDPDGYPFLCMGVNCVSSHAHCKDSEFVFPGKFGNEMNWAKETNALLYEQSGFNTLANWSSPETFKKIGKPRPYTLMLNIMATFSRRIGTFRKTYGCSENINHVMPVFHPDLPAYIDQRFQELAERSEDPWLFGVFSDNEISMYERQILSRYLSMGEKDSATQAARAWMAQQGVSEDAITEEQDRKFCKHVLSTYFGMIRKAMDRYLPHHMYIGTRFHKAVTTQISAYEAISPYADIVSVNLYHRWTPDQEALTEWSTAAQKPLMFTEWYVKGIDSGMRNISGAGMTVNTQTERGKFYENFTLSLIRNPNVVGWHWFRYMDDGPLHTGLHSCNKGVVNIHYQPYPEVIASMTRINRVAYSLRDALCGFNHPNLPNRAPVIEDPEFDEIETDRVYSTPLTEVQNG